MGMRRAWHAMALSTVGVLILAGLPPATAAVAAHAPAPAAVAAEAQTAPEIVSDDPSGFTPDVLDGSVKSIIQVGDRIVASGDFTQVREKGANKPTLSRTRVFSFEATTGRIDPAFAPVVDEEISVILAAPDGRSVFLGGKFKTVNGVVMRRLARVNLADGSLVSGFRNASIDAKVTDLRFIGPHLVVSGAFSTVWAQPRELLVALNRDTAAMTDFIGFDFADPLAGDMNGYKMDVSPDQSRLVLIGNFGTVDAQPRPQLAVFDTSGPQAILGAWRTSFYQQDACDERWWSYIRDVDFDPAGVYFVVTTSGAYRGPDAPCDMEARWEIGATQPDVTPTWTAYTGGDTTYAVEVTDTAVYVGGHMRWFNNPWAWNQLGAGGVPRTGIGALDPKNGLPLSWDPIRDPRGVGVFDLLATADGLWMGSDTDGVHGETHRKLAHFPLVGGRSHPAGLIGQLPNDVYLIGDPQDPKDRVARRFLSEQTGPGAGAVFNAGDNGVADWSHARGATLIDGQVFAAWDDGSFKAVPFDGLDFGTPRDLDLYGTSESKGASNWFGTDAASVTGMFFDPVTNRLYYTLAGSDQLWWRPFTPESEVIGARRFAVTNSSDFDGTRVAGMFRSGDRIYFADRGSGSLSAVAFDGIGLTGEVDVVDSHVDWRAQAAFLWHGEPAYVAPSAPVADAQVTCAGADCAFDAGASSDEDGFVVSHEWSFSDGATASGETVRHVFDSFGPHTATLTVADNLGTVSSTQREFDVRPLPLRDISFVGATMANGNSTRTSVKAPIGLQTGDVMLLWLSAAADLTVTTPPGWTGVAVERDGSLTTYLYTKAARAGDAGTTVSVDYPSLVKNDVTLVAYRGVDAADPVLAVRSRAEGGERADHTAPDSVLSAESLRFVTYVVDKTSTTTSWDLPAGIARRSASFGSGGGRVTSVVGDQVVAPAPVGVVAGVTATANAVASQATMWSLALRPAQPAGPVAPRASADVRCTFLACALNGSGSSDADGEIVSFAWDLGDGSGRVGQTGSHTYAAPGVYQVRLTVTDADGMTDTVTRTVDVDFPNVAPVARVGHQCSLLECSFDGAASADPDGSIASFMWDFGDGSTGSGDVLTHAYAAPGAYSVTLTVTDNDGAANSQVAEVVVMAPPTPPRAQFTVDCRFLECSRDGAASADPDGSIASFEWDFGDGSTGAGGKLSHGFTARGTYSVTLTVTDDDGMSHVAAQDVTVVEQAQVTVEYVGRSIVTSNTTSATAPVPTAAEAGDTLIAFVTTNAVTQATIPPTGWSLVGSQSAREMSSFVYVRTVPEGVSAPEGFRWGTSAQMKIDINIVAYRGGDATSPVTAAASVAESDTVASHVTPTVSAGEGSQQMLSFWAEKTSGATSWTLAPGLFPRSASYGSGSGRVNSLVADLGDARPLAGAVGAAIATSDLASRKAVMWTVLLRGPRG